MLAEVLKVWQTMTGVRPRAPSRTSSLCTTPSSLARPRRTNSLLTCGSRLPKPFPSSCPLRSLQLLSCIVVTLLSINSLASSSLCSSRHHFPNIHDLITSFRRDFRHPSAISLRSLYTIFTSVTRPEPPCRPVAVVCHSFHTLLQDRFRITRLPRFDQPSSESHHLKLQSMTQNWARF
ncbi:hypothetical protein BCV70DRAFT_94879 [Testicularia cyperi]|uniref:Uncharacterized protein n=1 Tax=Testicularia cyperi TaxID=1882483 RepID=A0A317XQL9_9BASI|nr:hypothetical protein BCV70DRAFT_94879 [Testicularia cyperi]